MELVVNGDGINVCVVVGDLNIISFVKLQTEIVTKCFAVKNGWYKVGNDEWIFL